jgi:hypothetical protein
LRVLRARACRAPPPRQVRLYSYLFTCENPNSPPGSKPPGAPAAAADAAAAGGGEEEEDGEAGEGAGSWLDWLNKDSLVVDKTALVEPHLAASAPGTAFQFQRIGYFVVDLDSTPARPVFNRIVALKEGADRPVAPAKGGGKS